jgi:hypothetical protein
MRPNSFDQLRTDHGGRADGLHRRHAAVDEGAELPGILPVRDRRGIGSARDADSCGNRLGQHGLCAGEDLFGLPA